MTNGRGSDDFGETAKTYAKEIVLGLKGIEIPEVKAKPLEHGKRLEPEAIKRYELETFQQCQKVEKPIFHPSISYICGLPDRLISVDGLLEVKCPFNPLNHLDNLARAAQYKEYKWQIQGYLWITERNWCDFVSYHPEAAFRMFRFRVYRDSDDIELIKTCLDAGIEYKEKMIQAIDDAKRLFILGYGFDDANTQHLSENYSRGLAKALSSSGSPRIFMTNYGYSKRIENKLNLK
jgi:hypothetical protein